MHDITRRRAVALGATALATAGGAFAYTATRPATVADGTVGRAPGSFIIIGP